MTSEIKVLDHGLIQLIDSMGDDARIIEAARTSISGEKIKATSQDRILIRYLMRHAHWTPFEMVKFTFFMKLPIFVARQLIRHRTANVNEMSMRYSVAPREYYVPEDIKFQSTDNKQGSGGSLPPELNEEVQHWIRNHSEGSFELYDALLAENEEVDLESGFFEEPEHALLYEGGGVARELARTVLPVNTYTQWYWTMDLRNLFNFLKLRLDGHAQYEIRVYAQAVYDLIKDTVPLALEAFDDYILNAKTFSGKEMEVIKFIVGRYADHINSSDPAKFQEVFELEKVLGTKREVKEFISKIGLK